MIAPEYFNNHIAVEGEIIVKRVPNDTGSVLVWNSGTKKLSMRTHAEIVSDLNLMTTNNSQNFVASKIINGSYNANDLKTNSITYGYNVDNAPLETGSHSFSILNLDSGNPDYNMQLGFDIDTNEMWSRIKSAGNWGQWSKYTISASLNTYYKTFGNPGVTSQNDLIPNGNQAIAVGNSGNNFDGELANKTLEGTFANFNGGSNVSKTLGFTLFASTSTGQGMYYKTWYNSNSPVWKRLIDSEDIKTYYKKIQSPYAINTEDAAGINSFNQLNGTTQIGCIDAEGSWWHTVNIQHRNGYNDGAQWAGQMRFGMTGNLNTFQFRQRFANNYNEWKTVYHSGNLNINDYAKSDFVDNTYLQKWENAQAVGFHSGSSDNAPYVFHKTGGYIHLASQLWTAQNYALRAGSNATGNWVNSSNALQSNPFIPDKIKNLWEIRL